MVIDNLQREKADRVSVREFVEGLLRCAKEAGIPERMGTAFNDEALIAAGIDPEAEELVRLDAAILLHKYLEEVPGTEELSDISAAAELADLYDCRKCVNHIAQVYLRGLMDPVTYHVPSGRMLKLFDAKRPVAREEADDILTRLGVPAGT